MRIDIHNQFRCIEMFGKLQLEKGVIGVIEFFQSVCEFTFIALADLTISFEHLRYRLGSVLLRMLLTLCFLLLLSHLHIHFPSHLLSIRTLLSTFLLLLQPNLLFPPLSLLHCFLLIFHLFQPHLHEQILLQCTQILFSFDPLWGSYRFTVV